jgi:hypothetical protein
MFCFDAELKSGFEPVTCQHGLARSLFPIRDVVVLGADGPARPVGKM